MSVEYRLQPHDRKYDGRRLVRRWDEFWLCNIGACPLRATTIDRRPFYRVVTAAAPDFRARPARCVFIGRRGRRRHVRRRCECIPIVLGRAPLPRDTRVSHLKYKSLSRPSYCTSSSAPTARVSFLPCTLMTHSTAFSLSPLAAERQGCHTPVFVP